MLWIAFKNYYLRDEEQQYLRQLAFRLGCELLSKIIIFVMKNNVRAFSEVFAVVVNCFQKLLSSWWRTTVYIIDGSCVKLWIAFKNYYLRDEEQRLFFSVLLLWGCELLSKIIIFVMKNNSVSALMFCWLSCELLSKIIIFVMKNNFKLRILRSGLVVNCFQKLLSSWWRTTFIAKNSIKPALWIAFKNYYLRDEEQRFTSLTVFVSSCELLSKIIIFVMKNNSHLIGFKVMSVVNCFQKLLSSWWRTTNIGFHVIGTRLWIAFKNYYLRDEEQLKNVFSWISVGCELLSKIIIFVMKNNLSPIGMGSGRVVNCFQKLLSSWWRTTKWRLDMVSLLLWIAFKNYYLRDEEQRLLGFRLRQGGCELLSKIIIFVMKNNRRRYLHYTNRVVNCFQKLLSSWWRTTRRLNQRAASRLWIAFKNYYLRDEEQQCAQP